MAERALLLLPDEHALALPPTGDGLVVFDPETGEGGECCCDPQRFRRYRECCFGYFAWFPDSPDAAATPGARVGDVCYVATGLVLSYQEVRDQYPAEPIAIVPPDQWNDGCNDAGCRNCFRCCFDCVRRRFDDCYLTDVSNGTVGAKRYRVDLSGEFSNVTLLPEQYENRWTKINGRVTVYINTLCQPIVTNDSFVTVQSRENGIKQPPFTWVPAQIQQAVNYWHWNPDVSSFSLWAWESFFLGHLRSNKCNYNDVVLQPPDQFGGRFRSTISQVGTSSCGGGSVSMTDVGEYVRADGTIGSRQRSEETFSYSVTVLEECESQYSCQDWLAFWLAGDPRADLNGDGFVDGVDYNEIVRRFCSGVGS